MALRRSANDNNDRPKRSSSRTARDGDSTPKRPSAPRGKTAQSSDRTSSRPSKKYSDERPGDKKPYAGKSKPYTGRAESDGEKKSFAPKKPYSGRATSDSDRPKRTGSYKSDGSKSFSDRPARDGFKKREGGFDDKPARSEFKKREGSSDDRPARSSFKKREGGFNDKPARDNFKKREGGADDKPARGGFKKRDDGSVDKPYRKTYEKPKEGTRTMRGRKTAGPKEDNSGLIRLNRYIANAGICSRRKADELILAGVVSVNGEVVSELGSKVDPMKDDIRYNGELLKREKMVYVLLNKPKDYITTTDDPQERRTVMHLVEKATRERIYPIGRLDRNTTGLLLMTNDGDLADKLSHPRSNVVKLYHIELSKSFTQGDMNKLQFGLELEDGPIKPDAVSYVTGGTKREIGIQIHSGKNRIVRRIFEHLGYEVVKLDRVVYAGLTKKDLPRGRWRYLEEKEVIQLKHLI